MGSSGFLRLYLKYIRISYFEIQYHQFLRGKNVLSMILSSVPNYWLPKSGIRNQESRISLYGGFSPCVPKTVPRNGISEVRQYGGF